MNILKTVKSSFTARILIIVFVVISLMTVSFTALFIEYESKASGRALITNGLMLSRLLAYNCRLGVFSESESLLLEPVAGILRQDNVLSASVYTAEGTLLHRRQNGRGTLKPETTVIEEATTEKIRQNLKTLDPSRYFENKEFIEFWAPVVSALNQSVDEPSARKKNLLDKEHTTGFVKIAIDKSEFNKEIRAILLRSISTGVVFLLIAVFIAYNIVIGITRPLNRLTAAVAGLEAGTTVERVNVESTDEIGKLAAAFNNMTEVLIKREESLTSLNVSLNREIEEKTSLQKEAMRSAQLAALGELAAGVAHEINNPINSIINHAQLLIDEGSEAGGTAYAGQIIREGDRVASIVRSLLSFARDRQGDKSPVSITDAITESLNLVGAQLKKDNIRVILEIPPALPDVMAYMYQLEQVFLNIISNARYALNQKYPAAHADKILEISGEEAVLGNSPYVRVIFHDHGIGMPADIMHKAMNPFFTTKPAGTGTGLGLSISYGIISDHGGTLVISSIEGSFTEVSIELPVKTQ